MNKKEPQQSLFNPVQLLEGALELLSDEFRWCQGAFAKNFDGDKTKSIDPSACSYCIMGAIRHQANDDFTAVLKTWKYIESVIGTSAIAIWNDDPKRTHNEIIETLKQAIVKAKNDNKTHTPTSI